MTIYVTKCRALMTVCCRQWKGISHILHVLFYQSCGGVRGKNWGPAPGSLYHTSPDLYPYGQECTSWLLTSFCVVFCASKILLQVYGFSNLQVCQMLPLNLYVLLFMLLFLLVIVVCIENGTLVQKPRLLGQEHLSFWKWIMKNNLIIPDFI